MPKRRTNSPRAELDEVSRRQEDLADVCARIFKALNPLLRKEGIRELNLEQMIFSRISKGVVVHLPVRLGEEVTKRDLYTGAHGVGVLANTTALFDRLSQTALAPGVYLVKIRAISKCAWAFDFVEADGRKVLPTPANLVDPERFKSIALDLPIFGFFLGFDVYIDHDPNALLPGEGPEVICISYRAWQICFEIGML
jgi:hypothetical protein